MNCNKYLNTYLSLFITYYENNLIKCLSLGAFQSVTDHIRCTGSEF